MENLFVSSLTEEHFNFFFKVNGCINALKRKRLDVQSVSCCLLTKKVSEAIMVKWCSFNAAWFRFNT